MTDIDDDDDIQARRQNLCRDICPADSLSLWCRFVVLPDSIYNSGGLQRQISDAHNPHDRACLFPEHPAGSD
ncbi:MAG: hypothetical protein MK110_18760 [Fuerstiella sp.]|nr:hypothetical protein [Fuerstiella sp.]